jgi:hypothetical protein
MKEAGDPNLDLLNIVLAASLVGAENVDKGKVTEAQYKLQLAELNARITEQKRRQSFANAEIQIEANADFSGDTSGASSISGSSGAGATSPTSNNAMIFRDFQAFCQSETSSPHRLLDLRVRAVSAICGRHCRPSRRRPCARAAGPVE